MNLLDYKEIINNKPMHIATVREDNTPNLAVVADVNVISNDEILISHNEMENTPKNILVNSNVVLTTFNEKWEGLRIFGTAEYFTEGEYFDLNIKLFKNETTNPKGAIVVKVSKVEKML
jgi:predicted pyridoxine 5'-phosphate oxidase superfamily flavin-nucleotide-binding protein